MKKLGKNEFCAYMNKLMCAFYADEKMDEIRMMCGSDFLGSDLSFLGGEVIELLAIALDVSIDDLDLFCYEYDFGRRNDASAVQIGFKYENGELVERCYDWSTIDKFYDSLMEMKNG